jgi:hypothetical protein
VPCEASLVLVLEQVLFLFHFDVVNRPSLPTLQPGFQPRYPTTNLFGGCFHNQLGFGTPSVGGDQSLADVGWRSSFSVLVVSVKEGNGKGDGMHEAESY